MASASFALGKLTPEQREQTINQVHGVFPSDDGDINTEAIRLLVALNDTGVIRASNATDRNPRRTANPRLVGTRLSKRWLWQNRSRRS